MMSTFLLVKIRAISLVFDDSIVNCTFYVIFMLSRITECVYPNMSEAKIVKSGKINSYKF